MKKFLIFCIAVLLLSCAPTYLVSKEQFKAIPVGSKKIVVQTDLPAEQLFAATAQSFGANGWPVIGDKNTMQILSSNPKDVGGGTLAKGMAFVQSTNKGSQVTLSGDWGLTNDAQAFMQAFTGSQFHSVNAIEFGGTGKTKPDIAFQSLLVVAQAIPGGRIFYDK